MKALYSLLSFSVTKYQQLWLRWGLVLTTFTDLIFGAVIKNKTEIIIFLTNSRHLEHTQCNTSIYKYNIVCILKSHLAPLTVGNLVSTMHYFQVRMIFNVGHFSYFYLLVHATFYYLLWQQHSSHLLLQRVALRRYLLMGGAKWHFLVYKL